MKIINQQNLKEKDYQIIEVSEEIPKARINEFENQKYISESQIDENKRFLNPTEMSIDELDYFIEYYRKCSIDGQHLKSRKYSRNLMNKLILEKDLRIK